MKNGLLGRWTSGDTVGPDRGAIKVYIRDLDQLFDSLDPSPFHERDLDRNAEEYIVASARELASKSAPALVVYLDRPAGLPDEGQIIGKAIREHFARRSQLARWELRRLVRRGWISLIIGLGFLAATIMGGESAVRLIGRTAIATVIQESLLIGGWVAMWRPLEIFLYDWWPLLGERRVLERLSRMPVQIVYSSAARADIAPRAGGSRHERRL